MLLRLFLAPVTRLIPAALLAGACLFPLAIYSQEAEEPGTLSVEAAGAGAGAAEKPRDDSGLWEDNFVIAKSKAYKENKDLFMLFTGSDWIELCQIYEKDILNQPAFRAELGDQFIMLKLDFPQKTPQPNNIRLQNQLLFAKYRIRGFPTVILADDDARPYAVLGYQKSSPKAHGALVATLQLTRQRRDQKLEAADKAEGVEKAKLLAEAIPVLPGNLAARFYRDEMEQAIKADPENQTGKAAEFKRLIADVDYSNKMSKLNDEVRWSEMIELTDTYIVENKLQGLEKQNALLNKLGIQEKQGNVVEMLRTLQEIIAIDPTSGPGQKAQGVIAKMRSNQFQNSLNP